MIFEVFIKLLLAHIIGDFFLQSDDFCKRKLKNGVKSPELYLHSLIIFTLSWIALFSWNAWGIAIIAGASHLIIDTIKCLIKKDNLYSFAADQLLHCLVIFAIANFSKLHDMKDFINIDDDEFEKMFKKFMDEHYFKDDNE